MSGILRHVTSRALPAPAVLQGWHRLFQSYNGPSQSFGGAYDENWFRSALTQFGLEAFTLHPQRGKGTLGLVLVFFDLGKLPPGHGLPGVYVDSTTFGTRLGRVGAFAGEAYLLGSEETAGPALTEAVATEAKVRGLDCLIGAMSVDPLDPSWRLTMRSGQPAMLDGLIEHPLHGTVLRRMVTPVREGARFELGPKGVALVA